MNTFKKNATGYIVVNLSKGPALNPTIHQSLSAARSEADRLAKENSKDTFQVFGVIPDGNTYRYYSEKVWYGYVFACGGSPTASLAIYESKYAARKQASDLRHECLGTFEVRTQEAVGDLSPSEVRYQNVYQDRKGMFLFKDRDEAVRVGMLQSDYTHTIEVKPHDQESLQASLPYPSSL